LLRSILMTHLVAQSISQIPITTFVRGSMTDLVDSRLQQISMLCEIQSTAQDSMSMTLLEG